MIPLFVDCSGRRIVIFGGGNVAARKAAYFSGKAGVVVVSRSFVPAFDELAIQRQERDLGILTDPELDMLINNAFLVIAAVSDPAINNRIGKICKVQGILFNNADGEKGDVVLPAVTGGEHYSIAVSTHGSSPAVARFVREELEDEFPTLDAMIVLQEKLREALKKSEPDQIRRNAVLRDVLDDHTVWEQLMTDEAAAWNDVQKRYLHG
ncbi:MAG: bifunctional precorrin-2 dehydrogenase/sirohydrochlorin ferrochelatase [Methanoregula sp.]|jgi:precorrin-2 dehydrogenase/sirohydrochlorin ferrochelatase|uniref:precorrin-2 dehydrogenase/sirohydrochlorin ferrochelatase family protein n=1 Tax=Methanoregula sp. TaxID=2052170 RepID=UPI0025CE055B|nr:bifunctional precorrin-2 dehydrogenase/sirohydrochlorin ferrochelatase [Methanoregula sp.]MCK9631878.1 bifunctional precorrin-2 dehydrogenase/sirohydrochlorin ferrochelatase [Methanoregula sp.]